MWHFFTEWCDLQHIQHIRITTDIPLILPILQSLVHFGIQEVRYDNVTLSPLVLLWGLRFRPYMFTYSKEKNKWNWSLDKKKYFCCIVNAIYLKVSLLTYMLSISLYGKMCEGEKTWHSHGHEFKIKTENKVWPWYFNYSLSSSVLPYPGLSVSWTFIHIVQVIWTQ